MELKKAAVIHTDFSTKFGVPRQSNMVESLQATIVFEPEYRNPDALRGLEEFTYIWLLWGFSKVEKEGWTPMVRPPRLGGNTRMGVFATRSPFRPNPIGLSSVKLEKIEFNTTRGPVLHVLGADLMDKTPIYDIKPYLPYVDSHPEAMAGFASQPPLPKLQVVLEESQLALVPQEKRQALQEVLAHDPRPSYQNMPQRVYGMEFCGLEVRFMVEGEVLRVVSVTKAGR